MSPRTTRRKPSAAVDLQVSGGDGVYVVHGPGPLPAHLAETARALLAAPAAGQATVVVGAGFADPDALCDHLAPALDACAAARVGVLRLVMTGGAAELPHRAAPARRITERWDFEVVAPAGVVVVVPGGTLFTPDLPETPGAWWQFSRGLLPRRLGSRHPEPGWQTALDRVVPDTAEGCVVHHIPAGLLVLPVGVPAKGVDAIRYALPVDPAHPVVLVGSSGAAEVSADSLADIVAALPAQVRGSVRLLPGNGRDLLPTAQQAADLLGIELQVANGLPVLLDDDNPAGGSPWEHPLRNATARTMLLDAEGNPSWRPYVESVTCVPAAPTPRLTSWRPPIGGLRPGREPGTLRLDRNWQVAVTRAGLWVGPCSMRLPEVAANRPVEPDVMAIDLGHPDRSLDDATLWPPLQRLFGALQDDVRERTMIQLHGEASPATHRAVRSLAVQHGLAVAARGWRPILPGAVPPGGTGGRTAPSPTAPSASGGTPSRRVPDPRVGEAEWEEPQLPEGFERGVAGESGPSTSGGEPGDTSPSGGAPAVPPASAGAPGIPLTSEGDAAVEPAVPTPLATTTGSEILPERAVTSAGSTDSHELTASASAGAAPSRPASPRWVAAQPGETTSRANGGLAGPAASPSPAPYSADPDEAPDVETPESPARWGSTASRPEPEGAVSPPAPASPAAEGGDPEEPAPRAPWPPAFPALAAESAGPGGGPETEAPEPPTPWGSTMSEPEAGGAAEPSVSSSLGAGTAGRWGTNGAGPEAEGPLRAVRWVPVRPLRWSVAAERDAVRERLGDEWDAHSGVVARALTRVPALRSGAQPEEAAADLATLHAYVTAAEGEPWGYEGLRAEVEAGRTGLVPFLACLASALRRLPSYRGAVVRSAGTRLREAAELLVPGEELGEAVPVSGIALDKGYPPVPADHYLIWSMTGRRAGSLLSESDPGSGPASADEVLFAPGTRLRVLAVDDRAGATVVLLRELPEAAPRPTTPGVLDDADNAVLKRLYALKDQPTAVGSGLPRPDRCAGVLGVLPAPE
jgi:hypothetical protein